LASRPAALIDDAAALNTAADDRLW